MSISSRRQAALGIAGLCVMAMIQEGLSSEDAHKRIFMIDSRGLIVKNRPAGGVIGHKVEFAQDMPPMKEIAEVVDRVKPTALIGKLVRYACVSGCLDELLRLTCNAQA